MTNQRTEEVAENDDVEVATYCQWQDPASTVDCKHSLSLLSNINVEFVIVPWTLKLDEQNLQLSLTDIFTLHLVLFVYTACACAQRSFRPVPAYDIRHDQTLLRLVMADPEWHWADPIVLNFNRHPPPSEWTFANYSSSRPSVQMKWSTMVW